MLKSSARSRSRRTRVADHAPRCSSLPGPDAPPLEPGAGPVRWPAPQPASSQPADRLIAAGAAARQLPPWFALGPWAVERRETTCGSHRPILSRWWSVSPGRAETAVWFLIIHGRWDDPESLRGLGSIRAEPWRHRAAANAIPAVDPRPAAAMLSGTAPPPPPPPSRQLSVAASCLVVIDVPPPGKLGGWRTGLAPPIFVACLVSVGAHHRAAAAAPSQRHPAEERCGDVKDPAANLSWVLGSASFHQFGQRGLAGRFPASRRVVR